MQKVVLQIPEKISTNAIYEGKHWSYRNRLKKRYLKDFIEVKNKFKTVTEYPTEITYNFSFKGKALDSSNCSYMAKLIEDCLKEYGIIADDDPSHVSATHLYSTKGKRDEVAIHIL